MPYATRALRRAHARANKSLFAKGAEEEIARVVAEAHAEMDAQREREAFYEITSDIEHGLLVEAEREHQAASLLRRNKKSQ